MPRKRFTEEQITRALRQAESGITVRQICRDFGITEPTFYLWKKRYGSLGVPEVRELHSLRDENRKLKQLVADLNLDKHILQETLRKKL
jgi:putative transposase